MRVKTITCPNCGHASNFLAEECTQCGINFSRYYEELEKAETLRRHIEEQEKAAAQQPPEAEKAPPQTEAPPIEGNETPPREAENTSAADADTTEIEDLDPAAIEEHAGAFDFIEYPADDTPDAERTETPDKPGFPLSDYPPASTLEERLLVYEGRMLGLTYGDPAEIQNVKLLAVSRDHFQVFYPVSRHIVSFPYRAIASITENAKGVSAVGPDISPVFPMVVELPRPFFHAD